MVSSIKDVAKLSGVSISTVSRVINNAKNVNPQVRKNVLKAVTQLNYVPNRIAQSLSGAPLKSIAIAMSRSSNSEYTTQILSSISDVMSGFKYNIIINNSKDEDEELQQCLSMIKGKIVRGIILIGSKNYDLLIEKLYEANVAFVVIGKVSNKRLAKVIHHIDTNNFDDCKNAVEYLFSCGHKNIACLHSDLTFSVNTERLNGYIEAHKNKKNTIDYSLIIDGGFTVNDAFVAATNLLKLKNRPTAIFATDDIKAMGCYKAAYHLGLKIPHDISIMGHNDYEISQVAFPSLTTINVPINELGKKSAEILYNIINGKNQNIETILPTELIVRDSCKSI